MGVDNLSRQRHITLRIITAYRPVLSNRNPKSVYNQHRSYYLANDVPECPRKLFNDELLVELIKWISIGNQIVLGIDINEDIAKATLVTDLQRIGLSDIITKRYGTNAPPTHADGSKVIDGIFTTSALSNCRCGFLPVLFDHRALWIEVPMDLALGTNLAPTYRPQARRLKLEDPRIVTRFLDIYEAEAKRYNLLQLAEQLLNNNRTTNAQYDHLDNLKQKCRTVADAGCRKLQMGATPWSPDYRQIELLCRYWYQHKRCATAVSESRNNQTKRKTLDRMAKRCGLVHRTGLTLNYITDMWVNARRLKAIVENNADQHRSTHCQNLADAKAKEAEKEQNWTTALRLKKTGVILQQMRQTEIQRDNARQMKSITKNNVTAASPRS